MNLFYFKGYFIDRICPVISLFFLLYFRHARVANLHALLVTLLPGSVGLSLHMPGSPEPNSGCRSYNKSLLLSIYLRQVSHM